MGANFLFALAGGAPLDVEVRVGVGVGVGRGLVVLLRTFELDRSSWSDFSGDGDCAGGGGEGACGSAGLDAILTRVGYSSTI